MTCTLHVAWDERLASYDFGPGHPLAPVRVELTMPLARAMGVLGADGVTVAVLACGVDVPYPVGHAELLESVAAQGVIVSEWPPGRTVSRLRFLVRNRVIAALATGTLVVEAGERSGAVNTARHARDLGRCRPAPGERPTPS